MKILIVIPAYNEAENIERVVETLKKQFPGAEYLVVNDCSTDHTVEICREHHFTYLDLPINLGLSGAFQAGLRYAQKYGYDCAIQFDGDGQHRSEYIAEMAEVMQEQKMDIVIGSRFLTQKKPHTLRMLGSSLISFAIRITTGKQLTDPTSGMRMFNRKLIIEFSTRLNYGPEPDTIAYLLRNKARVQEVQVSMDERIAGESYLNMARSIRYMMNMLISILFIQFFRVRK